MARILAGEKKFLKGPRRYCCIAPNDDRAPLERSRPALAGRIVL
jgi:hypothetical protein